MVTYKILDPRIGAYTEVSTVEAAAGLVAEIAIEMYLVHTHGVPFSLCEKNSEGIETWYSPSSTPIPNYEMLLNAAKEKATEPVTTIPVTAVEVLP